MDFDEIRNYWNKRAAGDESAQSTTQDFYLREIEFRCLRDEIEKISPSSVIDAGCGDGRTTARLAEALPTIKFQGFDYSESMISNARRIHFPREVDNLQFKQGDISEPLADKGELIYTTRCLINLPNWEGQKEAIMNIQGALPSGGVYLMIENFIEGHENFNSVRALFDLPPISVRDHNCFFARDTLLSFTSPFFELVRELNVSSTYYLVSRVIYSKICAEKGVSPDYFDDHHKYGSALPFTGEFGPIRLVVFRKK